MAGESVRKEWEQPTLTFVGNLHEIVLGGVGKSSPVPKDPGEFLKVLG